MNGKDGTDLGDDEVPPVCPGVGGGGAGLLGAQKGVAVLTPL